MIPENVIEEVTARISKSVDRVLSKRSDKSIETEPNITDQLLANIERDFENLDFPGSNKNITLKTRTLRDRGRVAPESIYGADLATILNIKLADYSIQKGFLAQSKWSSNAAVICRSTVDAPYISGTYFVPDPYNFVNPAILQEKSGTIEFPISASEFERLVSQCEKMLRISSDSFVFIYTYDDIYIIPATSIIATEFTKNRLKYYCKNFKLFMAEYLKSFIGDPSLRGHSDSDFKRLLQETNSRSLLYLEVAEG